MPSFRTSRTIQHSPEKMFELVADVERYPEFLPFCTGLTVRSRATVAAKETITATMSVGYKAIQESFTTRVALDREGHKIEVAYIDGPFRRLQNIWAFVPADGADCCRIDFFIDYEFKNRLLGMLVGAMFDQAFRRFVVAFEARADVVYGKAVRKSSPKPPASI